MATTFESRTISIRINRPADMVYDFMSDEKFAQDAEWAKRDLNALKNLLEA
jgi:hypothetical protein